MELKCLCCENEFEGTISKDELGWHSVCDDCGSSFDVDVPEGRIVMAFANPDFDSAEPYNAFYCDSPVENICAYFAFNTPKEFINKWHEMIKAPAGIWYWVMDGDDLVLSGQCDPEDIVTFRERWGLEKDVLVQPNNSSDGKPVLGHRIEFEEKYESAENESTTFYFKAPKEMLNTLRIGDYPDAVAMEISIEFPSNHIEPAYGSVCVSPTNAEGSDYDWTDVDLPYDEIEALIDLANKSIGMDGLTVAELIKNANVRSAGANSKLSDKDIEKLWDSLEDVPIDEEECLDVDWNGWTKGTHREEIWHWFDEHHSKGVGWLMNEYEPSSDIEIGKV